MNTFNIFNFMTNIKIDNLFVQCFYNEQYHVYIIQTQLLHSQ